MISVLLPSVRPDKLPWALASIPAAAAGMVYEVIVVANWGPEEYPHTHWIVHPRTGPIDAIDVAYRACSGEYIFLFNDQSKLEPGALVALYHAAVADPNALLGPHHEPRYRFVHYRDKVFVPFPFGSRSLFDKLGGLLDTRYKAFYGDPDLGMRAHAAGVPIRTVDQAVIRHDNKDDDAKRENWNAYFLTDQATYRARWDAVFGEFHDC